MIIILTTGCTTKKDAEINKCNSINSTSQKDDCFLKLSEEYPEREFCEKIQKDKIAHICDKNVAVATQSARICEEILDSKVSSECYTEVAVAKLDHLVCRRIDRVSKKDACEMAVGDAKRKKRKSG